MRPSWAAVYAAGVPYLRDVLPVLGVAERDIDDVMQDVLMAAYRGLDRYDASPYERAPPADVDEGMLGAPLRTFGVRRPWSPLIGWLFGIAWRQVGHYRERAHRRRELPVGLLDSAIFAAADDRLSLEQQVASAERAALVARLLAGLDPARRVILVMHDMLETPVADIADELGINHNTAQNRLRLGREDFRAAAKRLTAEMRGALRLGDRPFAAEAGSPRRPVKRPATKRTLRPPTKRPPRPGTKRPR